MPFVARHRVLFGFFFGWVTTHLFCKGDLFALPVSDRIPFAGVSVAAFAGFGAALRTLKIDPVHTFSLRLAAAAAVSPEVSGNGGADQNGNGPKLASASTPTLLHSTFEAKGFRLTP
ncbi:MAG TPA: hypothetical protein VF772_19110 [Terriglobales bacterium]